MKLTKAKLQQIIKEELDSIINEYDPPTSQTFGIGDPGSMNSPSQGERSKKCKDAGGMMAGDECQDPNTGKPINIDEDKDNKPSAGLSDKEKSNVAKKARKGKDIGKKGKNFDKVADKAAKKYGSKEAGEKVAAAAMWKNMKR
jgi:hypothetical protein